MKNILFVLRIAIIFTCFSAVAQNSYWKKSATQKKLVGSDKRNHEQYYVLDQEAFQLVFDEHLKTERTKPITLQVPTLSGELMSFEITEHAVFHPELEKKFPAIKSFSGWSADYNEKISLSYSHRGVDGITVTDVNTSEKTFIQKEKSKSGLYKVYSWGNVKKGFECGTPMGVQNIKKNRQQLQTQKLVDDGRLRTYRIAVSASGEYTRYHGGTVADALAAINATLTRVNEVFETDLGIRLQLVANNDRVIYTNPSTDPYTGNVINQVNEVLRTSIGNENFDVGHLFLQGQNGGNAGAIGTVCQNATKGGAFSSGENPEGDLFDLDFVSHELGHQFGANHTWSFISEGTSVQAEPGSGTTIMGYAGITGQDDVAFNGDDYFHYNSIQQITDYVRNETCNQSFDTANAVPQIEPIPDYVIPIGTAFVLTANATDPNIGDRLTYAWEQIDNGVVTNISFGPSNPQGANFRSSPPSVSPERYFPRLSRVIDGELVQSNPQPGSIWETVSNVKREMNFALTVRDNVNGGGQVASELVKVEVDDFAGPFVVTSQSSNTSYSAGQGIEVIWEMANTNQVPINAQQVDILLSIDGGFNYQYTLASNVPNSGRAQVQLPGLSTATSSARIMVKPSNNVFFALNAANFSISPTDVVMGFDQLNVDRCEPNELNINFDCGFFNGFSGTANFSAIVPSGIDVNFNPPASSANSTPVNMVLANLSSLSTGTYPITVIADYGASIQEVELEISIYTPSLEIVPLVSPLNGATEIAVNPSFNWQQQPNANAYDIEIATDETFGNIVETATVLRNNYTSKDLDPGRVYFWRVRPKNECAEGEFSTAFQFSTISLDCKSFAAKGLPLAISDEGSGIYTASIIVREDLSIYDVNVFLEMNHDFLGDLIIKLISPNGKEVVLTSNSCSSANDIDAVFDDSSFSFNCGGITAAIQGNVRPLGSLSTFKGESTRGEWILEITDVFDDDGGSLNELSMEICVDNRFRPDDDNDGVFDDGEDLCLGTPEGQEVSVNGCPVYRFDPSNFNVEINSIQCNGGNDGSIVVSASNTTFSYRANLTGDNGTLIRTFSDNVGFTELVPGNYRLCITGNDGDNQYQEKCFDIVISEPEPLEVSANLKTSELILDLELSGGLLYNIEVNGVVVAQTRETKYSLFLGSGSNAVKVFTNQECQGVFSKNYVIDVGTVLTPNPTEGISRLILQEFTGRYQLTLFSNSGQLLRELHASTTTGSIPIDLRGLPQGVYFVKIEGNGPNKTFKIIKE